MSTLVVLTILIVLTVIYTPLHFLMRARMTDDTVIVDRDPEYYRLTRATRITLMLFSVGIIGLGILAFLLYTVLHSDGSLDLKRAEFLLVISYGLVNFLIIFGIGIYASAIVTEHFTLNSLKEMEDFVPLRRLNDFYHGPFSHLLIFSGGPLLFWIIAAAESLNAASEPLGRMVTMTYLIYGILFGALYAYMQINNYTWRYQMPYAFATLLGFLFYWIVKEPDAATMPFNYFFLATLLTYNAGLMLYQVHHQRRVMAAEKLSLSPELLAVTESDDQT